MSGGQPRGGVGWQAGAGDGLAGEQDLAVGRERGRSRAEVGGEAEVVGVLPLSHMRSLKWVTWTSSVSADLSIPIT